MQLLTGVVMMVTVVTMVVVISLADAAEAEGRRLVVAPKGEHTTVLRRLTAVAHFTVHRPAVNTDGDVSHGDLSLDGTR